MADTSVLIVGAGPTGLVLALWLTAQGVAVRIIDKAAAPGTSSRALAVHARTLELYNQLSLADAVVAKGYAVPGVRLWGQGNQAVRVPLHEVASALTPYGFLHIFPQDEHERLLTERLEQLGVHVERSTELLGYAVEGDEIHARLRAPRHDEKTVSAAFLAGCDGAHSKVREVMGTDFAGGTYKQVFYVADVAGEGAAINGDLNLELDRSDFLGIFPLSDKGRIRLIGTIRPGEGKDLDRLTFDDVSERAMQSLHLKISAVNWFSVYHVHHRVAENFRKGRVFLLGDAAHIHTPVGGQGMNTGIGDAINLAWKIKTILEGRASDSLLDTYETERRAFALRLVQTTDRVFNLAAADGRFAQIMRTRIVPLVMPQLMKFARVREWAFRTVSQIMLNYRGKGLDQNHAGSVYGGDRMPWVKLSGGSNYELFKQIGWQVHVYGVAQDELQQWCLKHAVPLHVFPWDEALRRDGLLENALYLVRPDTYVALAQADQSPVAMDLFFARIGVVP